MSALKNVQRWQTEDGIGLDCTTAEILPRMSMLPFFHKMSLRTVTALVCWIPQTLMDTNE